MFIRETFVHLGFNTTSVLFMVEVLAGVVLPCAC